MFELRLLSFRNQLGVDNAGQCCGVRTNNENCMGSCMTFFNVCLSHYERKISADPQQSVSCTFGQSETPVIGYNSFNLTSRDSVDNFVNPIRLDFGYSWLVSVA